MADYRYPYPPPDRPFRYAPATHPLMRLAMRYARACSKDPAMPNASVIAVAGRPVAAGANGSDFHRLHGCRRQAGGSRTGEDYALCEGCHPRNHSERRALAHAVERSVDTRGADLYLWGHFGCCPPCWAAIIAAGIRDVYLLERAEQLFNRDHPANVIGSQFDDAAAAPQVRARVPGSG